MADVIVARTIGSIIALKYHGYIFHPKMIPQMRSNDQAVDQRVIAGVLAPAGSLDQKLGKEHLVLKEAAPGTFFAVLGCAIIVVALWRGIKIQQSNRGDGLYELMTFAARAGNSPDREESRGFLNQLKKDIDTETQLKLPDVGQPKMQ